MSSASVPSQALINDGRCLHRWFNHFQVAKCLPALRAHFSAIRSHHPLCSLRHLPYAWCAAPCASILPGRALPKCPVRYACSAAWSTRPSCFPTVGYRPWLYWPPTFLPLDTRHRVCRHALGITSLSSFHHLPTPKHLPMAMSTLKADTVKIEA